MRISCPSKSLRPPTISFKKLDIHDDTFTYIRPATEKEFVFSYQENEFKRTKIYQRTRSETVELPLSLKP